MQGREARGVQTCLCSLVRNVSASVAKCCAACSALFLVEQNTRTVQGAFGISGLMMHDHDNAGGAVRCTWATV
jgi:hypothetical protein